MKGITKALPYPDKSTNTLIILILFFISFTLYAKKENPNSTIDKKTLVEKSISQAETLAKDGKIKKAISVLEGTVLNAKSLNDELLLENIYTKLLEFNTKIKNKKKIEEYDALLTLIKSQRENKVLKDKTKQEEILIKKITHEKEEIIQKKKETEIENELTKEELKHKDSELHITRDSLGIMDLINREKESQINLLNKEKELNDLKVKEQELLIKEKEAAQKLTIVIIGSLLLGLVTVGILAFLIFKNLKQKKSYSAKIESQLSVIQHQHESITSSINYAQRIQNAMLPSEGNFNELIKDSFILFKPKDIVSGDFYWFYNINENKANDEGNKTLIAAVDCTGHGVPGAFMSMIGYNSLNMIASKKIYEPDLILSELNRSIRYSLQQHQNDNKDGMDMALCLIDQEKRTIEFAGAKNPLIIIKDGQLEVIKGDKHPIGGSQGEAERTFTKHVICIDQPTTIYLISDGYEDQFGGPENRKFMIKNLKELLLKIHQEPFEKQKLILEETIENWKGKEEKQIDDILVLGMKIV